MINLLSFDVEDYFHGIAYEHIPATSWEALESRLPHNIEKLLSILGRNKATFFILGWVAERHPSLVKLLYAERHEIACHGHMHRSISDFTPQLFKNDLLRGKAKIEDLIGDQIIGFRAPNFSITKKTYWALDIIQEAGFKYDSSIYPIRHDRYGIPKSPANPYKILDNLWEIPLSTERFLGLNVPFGGGAYLRLYPYPLTRFFIDRKNYNGNPFIFYQHPWELDNSRILRPRSPYSWLRRNLAIGDTERKLKKLLAEYQFMPIMQWLTTNRLL